MPAPVDDVLERDDYFAYWLAQAETHVREQAWRARMDDIAAALTSTLGRSWLETKARLPERLPMVGTRGKHALGQMVALPSVENVARLMALGVYLRRCAGIPAFTDVVTHLRADEQYEGGELQLALGYRLLRLGLADVAFEPAVQDGRKSDLAFSLGGTEYLFECYAPVMPRHAEYETLLGPSATRVSTSLRHGIIATRWCTSS